MYRYSKYEEFILENQSLGLRPLARQIIKDNGLDFESEFEALVGFIRRLKKRHHKALKKECETVGIPVDNVNHYWYKGKNFSIHAKGEEVKFNDEDIQEAVKGALEGYSKYKVKMPKKSNEIALKVVISDAHVGLEPNEDNESMFGYEYNKDIFFKNLDKVYEKVLSFYRDYGTFELLILEDLGDLADGWNGYTTRGGHKLPQNMNNKEVFDACVEGRYKLIRRIVESGVAKKYIVRSVTNDNHSGDFSWMIHRTVEKMIELSIDANIENQILNKFVEHFYWGDHCFLVSHGKSKLHMKHGMPFHLNDKTYNWITKYIDHHDIKSKYIHFCKGDLHRHSLETTNKFEYINYMSFAPGSGWQQENFATSYWGFSVEVIPKWSNEIDRRNVIFEFKKKI